MPSSRSLKLSLDGKQQVKHALTDKAWGDDELMDAGRVQVATVKSFRAGRPIERKTFVRICKELGLDWRSVVEIESPSTDKLIDFQNQADDKDTELLERRLKELLTEKTNIESRLRKIDKQISETEEKLKQPMSTDLALLLSRISNIEVLSEHYAQKVLRDLNLLRDEIFVPSSKYRSFCLEIEKWIECINLSLIRNNMFYMVFEPRDYNLYLMSENIFRYNDAKVLYEKLLQIIEEDLIEQTPESVKDDIVQCLDHLKNTIGRLIHLAY
jgi:hypothetical protein